MKIWSTVLIFCMLIYSLSSRWRDCSESRFWINWSVPLYLLYRFTNSFHYIDCFDGALFLNFVLYHCTMFSTFAPKSWFIFMTEGFGIAEQQRCTNFWVLILYIYMLCYPFEYKLIWYENLSILVISWYKLMFNTQFEIEWHGLVNFDTNNPGSRLKLNLVYLTYGL